MTMEAANRDKQSGTKWQALKKRLSPALILVLTIAVSLGLFLFLGRNPGIMRQFGNYGYLGVFIVSLASNASVLLPVPGILLVLPLVIALNPVLVGLAGAAGGIIGETTAYLAGYSGQGVVQKSGRTYQRVEGWMKRWGIWTIFVFSVAPFLPFDLAGLIAGALRLPLWKFLLVGWIGKSIKYVALALAAAYGAEAVLRYLRW